MGMDYIYAGSSSYQRFENEICDIAYLLGGKLKEPYKERLEQADLKNNLYIFGLLNVSDADRQSDKFEFPSEVNEVVVDWLNHPYKVYDVEKTKIIWEFISKHPEIKDISSQIWKELESLVEFEEGWSIC